MTRRLLVLLALPAAAGCVYYNAMYNANRLAADARRAEREGRPSEARNFWAQAGVKADSVIARHPDSKWHDDALVLRAEAYVGSQECEGNLPRLRTARAAAQGTALRERSALALGRCLVAARQGEEALLVLADVAESRDRERRAAARLLRAGALRAAGRPEEALVALADDATPVARRERLFALAEAGRAEEARALAREYVAARDSLLPWGDFLDALGRPAPLAASAWVDELAAANLLPSEAIGRLLRQDVARLRSVDRDRARARLSQLTILAGGGEAGERARVEYAEALLADARVLDELAQVRDSLDAIVATGGGAADRAGQLRRRLDLVERLLAQATPEAPGGDLQRFLLAEVVRDSLAAPQLAAALFAGIRADWPGSPYAGKALLLARELDPAWAQPAAQWLAERPDDPYVAALVGADDGTAVAQLEDSLAASARQWRAQLRPAPVTGRTPADSLGQRRPTPREGAQPGVGPARRAGRVRTGVSVE